MKKSLLLLIIAGLCFTGCQQKQEPAPRDLRAEEAAARAMLENFNTVMTTQDVDSMFAFIAEDALICGSDPAEIIDKEKALNIWKELAEGPEIDFLFLEENPFKMAPDGNSAVAISQFYVPMLVPNIPVRNIYHLAKIEGKWMILVWSTCFIPENKDLPKIFDALAAE